MRPISYSERVFCTCGERFSVVMNPLYVPFHIARIIKKIVQGWFQKMHTNISLIVKFEILTAVKMLMLFFWVVTPCGLLGAS
jgi:hypothetical protein